MWKRRQGTAANSDSTLPGKAKRRILPALLLRSLLSVTLLALVVLLAISYGGRYGFVAELICSFRIQLAIGILVLTAVCSIFSPPRRARIMVIRVALCLWSGWILGQTWLSHRPAGGEQETYKLISFNVLESNPNRDAVVELIRDVDPDLVLILEYAGQWPDHLQAIHDDYRYRVLQPRWHAFGIALFSKHPLKATEVVQLAPEHTDAPMILTQVELGRATIRLAAVHLLAPRNPRMMGIRNQELRQVAARLTPNDDPTILVGDFNCVPWSPFLTDLLAFTRLRDSRQGFGSQASWPADLSVLGIPIDHAFVSQQIEVSDRQVLDAHGSDHLPLMLEFSVGTSPDRNEPESFRSADRSNSNAESPRCR